MPPIIRVEEISKYTGQEVTVQGWVYNRTDKGKLVFLLVRDGSGFVQCVAFKGDLPEDVFDQLTRLPQESSVDHHRPGARGQARARHPGRLRGRRQGDQDRAAGRGGLPDGAQGARRGFRPRQPPPVDPHAEPVGHPARARHRHGRHPRVVRHERLHQHGHAHPDPGGRARAPPRCSRPNTSTRARPISPRSGQLYNEANIFAFGKVYCFGPTFRAEKSKTRRHLTEFWMVEPEIAFCDLDGLMEVEEQFVTHIVKRVLRERGPELKSLGPRPVETGKDQAALPAHLLR